MTQQDCEEREQRLIEALDRFHEGKETQDDLSIIRYETGLINYHPRNTDEHQRRIS